MKNRKGFTLVELIAVIGLLAILAGIFSINVINRLNKDKESDEKQIIGMVTSAADAYISLNPSILEDLYEGERFAFIYVDDLKKYGLLNGADLGEAADYGVIKISLDEDENVIISYNIEATSQSNYYLETPDIFIPYDDNNVSSATWCSNLENTLPGLVFNGSKISQPNKTITKSNYNEIKNEFNLSVDSCNVNPKVPGSYLITYKYIEGEEGYRYKIRSVHVIKDTVTLTFNATGGDPFTIENCGSRELSFSSATSKCTKTITKVSADTTYGTLPVVTRDKYTFNGWGTSASSGNNVKETSKVAIETDATLYAQWIENTVNIAIKKDDASWSSSGIGVGISTSNTTYNAVSSNTNVTNANVILNNISEGTTYYIWASDAKTNGQMVYTGKSFVGTTTSNETINYYTLELTKGAGINATSGGNIYLVKDSNGRQINISATLTDGYTFKKWTVTTGNTPSSTTSISTNVILKSQTSLTAVGEDLVPPNISATFTNDVKATKQSVSITATDTAGVTGYYVGTTNPSTNTVSYTSVTSTKSFSKTVDITSDGTYYVACKDDAGNISEVKSVTYRKYTVTVMTEKVSGTATTYNTTNYDAGTTSTYYIKNGTSLTLANIHAATSNCAYKGYSSSNSVSSVSTGTASTVSSNTNFYFWYARNQYTLTLESGTGVSKTTGGGTYKYGASVSISATMKTGYSFTSWSKSSDNAISGIVTSSNSQTITMPAGDVKYKANGKDTGAPNSVTITSDTPNKATSLTLTLKCNDNVGVTSYYYGTTSPTASSTYTPVTATTSFSITKSINAKGTYYLACKDANGNTSTESSITINSYKVHNMSENAKATTNYNTTDYTDSSATYLIANGTSLTLSNIYSTPSNYNYKGYSTTNSSSSPNTGTTYKVSSNVDLYFWHARKTYTLTLDKGTGISSTSGGGTYKHGVSVSISASASSGYHFTSWKHNSGTQPTGLDTSKNSNTITMPASDVKLTANAAHDSYTITYAANGGNSTPSSQSGYGNVTLAGAISKNKTEETWYVYFSCNSGTYNYCGTSSLTVKHGYTYTFNGWWDGSNLYSGGATYNITKNVTLTADWKSSVYTGSVTLPSPSRRVNYTFLGWYDGGGTYPAGNGYSPTANDITLIGQWKKK